jgi:hypothetical protein
MCEYGEGGQPCYRVPLIGNSTTDISVANREEENHLKYLELEALKQILEKN